LSTGEDPSPPVEVVALRRFGFLCTEGASKDGARMEPNTAITATSYRCFISYRHVDNNVDGRRWATWLHQSLERYAVPPSLVGAPNERGQPIPQRIFPVFRDEEELSVDADLSTPILRALENSFGMVVICSPRARGSRFVDDEVRLFKRATDGSRILSLVIAGTPDVSGLAEDCCFPNAYLHRTDANGDVQPDAQPPSNVLDMRTLDGQEGWTDPAIHQATLEAAGVEEEQAEAEAEVYAHQLEERVLRIVAHVLEVPPKTLAEHHHKHHAEMRKAQRLSRLKWGVVSLLLIAAASKGVQFSIAQNKDAEEAARQAESEARLVLQKKAELSAQQEKARKAQALLSYDAAMNQRNRPGATVEAFEKALRGPATAGHAPAQFELGRQLQAKDHPPAAAEEAVGWFEKAANQGHGQAMVALGVAYRDGQGTSRDLAKAELWLTRAAGEKNPTAKLELSRLLKGTGRTSESLRMLYEAAEAGQVGAQFELGRTYLAKTPSPDVASALKWLKAAADQGSVPAMRELGLAYLLPPNETHNVIEAIRWLETAEAKGDREAGQKLTQILDDEATIPKSRPEAFRWHLVRALKGNAASQDVVGVAYRDGLDVPVDLVKAEQFLRMAEKSGRADVQYDLGVLATKSASRFYSLENAFELKGRAARNGHLQAMVDLAKLYFHGWDGMVAGKLDNRTLNITQRGNQLAEREGFGTAAGETKGLQWLLKAAEGGHLAGMLELGQRSLLNYEKSKSPDDLTQAQRWLTAAAEKNLPEAQRELGLLLLRSNQPAGVDWIRKAAESGDSVSQYTLGVALRDGHGVKPNAAEALHWLSLAADQHLDEAEHALGLTLLRSKNPKETALAAGWILKAAEQGYLAAQFQLAELYLTGNAVKPDSAEAYKWFLIASTNTAATAPQKAVVLKQAQVAAARLSPEQRTEAQKAATVFSPTKATR